MSSELLRALAAYAARPTAELAPLAEALDLPLPTASEHQELFGHQLYPYASVYLGEDGMLGGEARDRVAGFWRALRLSPPAEPDHLATLLAGYAALADSDADAAAGARSALLWEHLLSWVPAWLARLPELDAGPYTSWGRLLGDALAAEAERMGAPRGLPLHLREAPPFDGAHLLAAVRTGMPLARADLARAGRDLGLGVRHGERAFILRFLLAQDAPGVLGWLASEAGRVAERYGEAPAAWLPVTRWWTRRAQAAATELHGLVKEAGEVVGAG